MIPKSCIQKCLSVYCSMRHDLMLREYSYTDLLKFFPI